MKILDRWFGKKEVKAEEMPVNYNQIAVAEKETHIEMSMLKPLRTFDSIPAGIDKARAAQNFTNW
ncbi:MAG: hypothetical protein K2N67_00830 [Mucispirillum sp.]|nr:hypothetical protein [Mucispirillum sp.]